MRPRGIPIGDDDLLEVRDSVKPDIGTFVLPIAPSSVDVSPGDVTLNFDGTGRREVGKLIFGDLVGVNHEEGVSI